MVAGAVVAAAIAAVLIWPRGTVRADLISATVRTIGAQTARVRLTSLPSRALQQRQNAVAMTATGVVDFSTPAIRANYPDGYSWIRVGGYSWQTVWPPVSWPPTWSAHPLPGRHQGGPPPSVRSKVLSSPIQARLPFWWRCAPVPSRSKNSVHKRLKA